MVSMQPIIEILQNPTFEVIFILTSLGIGITQGNILGKAIVVRFPKLQSHAKMVAVGFFFLFLANAILSVPRFASPEKIDLSKVFQATGPADLASIVFTILGVNTGFLAVLTISITIMTLILLRTTTISGLGKVFVLFFSALILVVTGLSRFTDYTPTNFEIFLYFLYQLGITIGIVSGTARKIKKLEN